MAEKEYIEREALQPTCNQLATTDSDYIKRSYLRKMAMLEMAYTMETETDAAVVLRMIEDAPAADVAPVRHGRWELENESWGQMQCSVCKKQALLEESKDDTGKVLLYVTSEFCPNCGALMDLEGEHNAD